MMRGERYYHDARHAPLRDWLENRDHLFLSYADAMEWYRAIVPLLDDDGKALLGCNDRFFLLTVLLRRPDAINEWLYYRCREIEIEPDGCLDLWAREHYKSTLITFAGVIQEIICNPEITIGIFSVTASNARKFLFQIKNELETSEILKAIYQDVFWEDPSKEAVRWSLIDGIIVKRDGNPKEPTVAAHGLVDGMPTGSHYGLLVYDDVVTPESVTNPEMIKKTTEAWELSDNLGAGDRRKWHVGTRYSFADTYGIILERGILKPRIYPATMNGRLDGKPVLLSAKRWEAIKNTQRSTVAAQMLQNPLAGSENTFDPRTFKTYEIRPSILNVYIMGDPSKGTGKGSDRTAIAVIGIDMHGNKYLLDGYRHRMKMTDRWKALKSLWLKWKMEPGVQMVRVGWERYGMQTDDEYFQERMRAENIHFEIRELAWPRQGGHSKRERIERLEPDLRGNRFFMPAVMHEDSRGPSLWRINADTNQVEKRPLDGHKTKAAAQMEAARQAHRIARPIRRIDEDRKPYDLTSALIEEMLFAPFAPKDDLVDAVSRIYDMEPLPPSLWENNIVDEVNSGFGFEDA